MPQTLLKLPVLVRNLRWFYNLVQLRENRNVDVSVG
jgi:hypothetical protein